MELLFGLFPYSSHIFFSQQLKFNADDQSPLYLIYASLSIWGRIRCRPILGLYINRSQTQECWNWGWGRTIPRKGIHKWDFRCSVCNNVDFFSPHSRLLHSSLLPIIVFHASGEILTCSILQFPLKRQKRQISKRSSVVICNLLLSSSRYLRI
jgi:hypothetical protein